MSDFDLGSPQLLALSNGQAIDAFGFLGPHMDSGKLVVRAFLPGALAVQTLNASNGSLLAEMVCQGQSALFVAELPADAPYPLRYRLKVDWAGGNQSELEDPYRFGPVLGEQDVWLLAEGTHLRPYEKLGAHPCVIDGVAGVSFAVWAPNAKRVSVVGSFNQWDGRRHVMRFRRECGVWEMFAPQVALGDTYKFEILTAQGKVQLKSDPFAMGMQLRPDTASVVRGLPPVKLMRPERAKANAHGSPISIYEVHLGSWRQHPGNHWLSYRELAEHLVPYVRDLGFTHIELLPVSEFPFDGSWGYQPVGLFAPTSRFGTAEDFSAFVDAAHDAGLGVILDWVPAHFPTDGHGLRQFDGTALYEYADPREGFHQDWNTLIFNTARIEVRNYLVGNALYWLERFGIDGLRVDAVASMLYRDYSRQPGQWIANAHGGRENLEAIAFLQRMNQVVGVERPGAITLAEESTSFPNVTQPPESGGLGFHYKWNMGWMHDTLRYFAMDPIYRRHHQNQLTFGLMYAFTENFVLPLSHDEVVHGKGSLITRMPGDEWQAFANLRAYLALMWAYPGKKLLFMGGEIAQRREWNADNGLDWHLLDQALHAGVQRLVRDVNNVYRHFGALHEGDHHHQGFEWISHTDAAQSVIAFVRRLPRQTAGTSSHTQQVLVVCNLTPVPRHGYALGVPVAGQWREIINTDNSVYGGSGVGNGIVQTEAIALHGQAQRLVLNLPPLATVMLVPVEPSAEIDEC